MTVVCCSRSCVDSLNPFCDGVWPRYFIESQVSLRAQEPPGSYKTKTSTGCTKKKRDYVRNLELRRLYFFTNKYKSNMKNVGARNGSHSRLSGKRVHHVRGKGKAHACVVPVSRLGYAGFDFCILLRYWRHVLHEVGKMYSALRSRRFESDPGDGQGCRLTRASLSEGQTHYTWYVLVEPFPIAPVLHHVEEVVLGSWCRW